MFKIRLTVRGWRTFACAITALLATVGAPAAQSVGDIAALIRQVDQLQQSGKYADALTVAQRALALAEQLGTSHPSVSDSLNALAIIYWRQGRYVEAEPLLKRALGITEKAYGPDHPTVAGVVENLANLYQTQARHADAEPLYKRSLRIRETLGPQSKEVGDTLNNFANLYWIQRRFAEAEPMFKRSLAIREKVLGSEHAEVARTLDNLGKVYRDQERYAEAETFFKRGLAIREKLRPGSRDLASSLINMSSVYDAQGRFAEAEPLHKRSLAILESIVGPEHADIGTHLNILANMYRAQGRYAEADPLFKRSLPIVEKGLGPEHPEVGKILFNLALMAGERGDTAGALAYQRRASKVQITRSTRDASDVSRRELGQRSQYFRYHVLAAHHAGGGSGVLSESFQMAQWALQTDASDALAQMSARFAAREGALAEAVRERQDLLRRRQESDRRLAVATGSADAVGAAAARRELSTYEASLDALDTRLGQEFPAYFQLARPIPPDIATVQANLKPHEALLVFLNAGRIGKVPGAAFGWVVTKTGARWQRLGLSPSEIVEHVEALRCGLDSTLWQNEPSQARCQALLKTSPATEMVGQDGWQVLPFHAERAHALYRALFGPFADLIADKHLIVVPDGALTTLPFNMLVTEPPKAVIPVKLADYRTLQWLGARRNITVLPSVGALNSLRQFAGKSRAIKPYLGVGNPLLDGPEDSQFAGYYKKQAQAARDRRQCSSQGVAQIAVVRGRRSARSFVKLFRGTGVDVEEVRRWTPLPETADELCGVARLLGVPESEILLGSRATEAALKELSQNGRLADYAILHLATHGALNGQVEGSTEPGLILTPPARGTLDSRGVEHDDGFLTASEIATLKLDAEWVILSACNTAAGSSENTEALSGMARAFFYAGARALLVSHWEVGSDAAVKLTTRAFAELKARPSIGRAEAFRLSMRNLIEAGQPWEAHPSQWAPFVLIGEGAGQ